jgi:hypothetical protein
LVLGPTTDHDPHRGIEAETLGIIDTLVAGQPTVERLAQESQEAVPGVLPGACATKRDDGMSEWALLVAQKTR